MSEVAPRSVAEQTRPSRLTLWALLVVMAGGYFAFFFARPDYLGVVGVSHYSVWFSDSYAVLASNDALAAGLDVYAPNPLDHFARRHVYPRWWLYLGKLGLTRADNLWIGATLAALFFAAAAWRLRPQNPRELLWYLAVWCSPPCVFAMERANNDLVIFVLLAAVAPSLLSQNRLGPFVALAVIALATKLKFYPAVAALVLLAGEDRRVVWPRILIAAASLAVVAWSLRQDFRNFAGVAPHPQGLLSLGAMVASDLLGWTKSMTTFLSGSVAIGATVLWLRSGVFAGWSIKPVDRAAWLNFLLGAVLLVGCFFASNSYSYRLIFAVWLAPFLWKLLHDKSAPPKVRQLARVTALLLLFVLWITPVVYGIVKYLGPRLPAVEVKSYADTLLLAEQPLIWAFFLCLLGFLAHFVREQLHVLLRSPRHLAPNTDSTPA
jgi:hypothetical protein